MTSQNNFPHSEDTTVAVEFTSNLSVDKHVMFNLIVFIYNLIFLYMISLLF